jgi:hypothetical protein
MPMVSVNLPANFCRRAGPSLHLHHEVEGKDSMVKTYPDLKERQITATNYMTLWVPFSKTG